jgi:DnaK suppressor protein
MAAAVAQITPSAYSDLRARLEAERAALLQQVADASGDADLSTATSGHGETEHIQLQVERALTSTLDRTLRASLEAVAYALARFDDGSYGTCTGCAVPIPLERLLAVPWTARCVRCETRLERRGV